MSTGREIRRLRNERGLTQAQLGAPRFTHAYVSSIESGRRRASQRALAHFAARLGVDAEDLAAGRPPGLEAELTLRVHEARLGASTGFLDEARADFERLIVETRRVGLTHLEARAIEGRALCIERGGDPDGAIEEYEKAEEVAAGLGPRFVVDPLVGRSRCLAMLGQARYAIHILETHMRHLSETGLADPDSVVRLQSALVSPYFDAGLYELAGEAARLATSLGERVQEPFRVATMFVNVARVMHFEGKHDEAVDVLRRAEHLFRQGRYAAEAGLAHLAHAFVLSDQDRFDDALAELEAAEGSLSPETDPTEVARVATERGRVLRRLGRSSEAAAELERAIPGLQLRDAQELALAHRELALCYLETDADVAEKHLRSAIEHYERTEDEVQLAVTYRYLGDLYAASNRRAASAEIYRMGLEALRERS